jgi:hypothetical protein
MRAPRALPGGRLDAHKRKPYSLTGPNHRCGRYHVRGEDDAHRADVRTQTVSREGDGSLAPVCDTATLKGTPGPHRTQQESSHPHDCPFDPTRTELYAANQGSDTIVAFRVDQLGLPAPAVGSPEGLRYLEAGAPTQVPFGDNLA